ncbi:hypothetical protein B5P46_09995 [Rhizobium leguminosarum]|uniref:Uncharacterized protein n=1 Tax=Rhizobium leguminosarum TaxID=384 RepID=A0A4Q1UE17_RHILE|nr:hypothetical protein B5P46_09995 [Rhizobium leguminosarum]
MSASSGPFFKRRADGLGVVAIEVFELDSQRPQAHAEDHQPRWSFQATSTRKPVNSSAKSYGSSTALVPTGLY